jgi:hypothetical protein
MFLIGVPLNQWVQKLFMFLHRKVGICATFNPLFLHPSNNLLPRNGNDISHITLPVIVTI